MKFQKNLKQGMPHFVVDLEWVEAVFLEVLRPRSDSNRHKNEQSRVSLALMLFS